jgi:hypothetical protein
METAVLTSERAARWMSRESEPAAAVSHGYSSMTAEVSFPLPLGPMERWDASNCGFDLQVEGMKSILLLQRMKVHPKYCCLASARARDNTDSSKERLGGRTEV